MNEATKFKAGTAYDGWRCVKVNAESVRMERDGATYTLKLAHYETGDAAITNGGCRLWAYDFKAEAEERPTFKVGETYAARSVCDHDCVFSATVVRRTAKTVTFREDGREYTRRISKGLSEFCGCEAVYPYGRYSMCPTFEANKTLADVTGDEGQAEICGPATLNDGTGEEAAPKPADAGDTAAKYAEIEKAAWHDGRVLVAVYGTLMRGECNEHWAREAGATVVGEGTVCGWLWDTGAGYPAIQTGCGGNARVAVELLETDTAGLAHMDLLEGYPNLYGRRSVAVTMRDGYTLDALIYQMRDMGEKSRQFTLIEPVRGVADWRKYRASYERAIIIGEPDEPTLTFPLNNDRHTNGGHVYKGDAMSVKDADGHVVLNISRFYFGKGRESRRRAVEFTSALVALLNEAYEEGQI